MLSKSAWVARLRRLPTHTILHVLAILIFVGNLLFLSAPWRDFGFVLASLLGVGAGITQTLWEQRHDTVTPVGQAIQWIVLGYLAIGGWGIGELYVRWATVYYGIG